MLEQLIIHMPGLLKLLSGSHLLVSRTLTPTIILNNSFQMDRKPRTTRKLMGSESQLQVASLRLYLPAHLNTLNSL